MKTIDIHAHVVPESLWKAIDAKHEWHGFRHEAGEGLGTVMGGGMRTGFTSPKVRYTVAERLKDMDAQKVDVQVLSIHTPFVGYHLAAAQGLALAREVNDEIGATVRGKRQEIQSGRDLGSPSRGAGNRCARSPGLRITDLMFTLVAPSPADDRDSGGSSVDYRANSLRNSADVMSYPVLPRTCSGASTTTCTAVYRDKSASIDRTD